MESQDFAQSALECGDLTPLFSINQREIAAPEKFAQAAKTFIDSSKQIPHSCFARRHSDLVILSSVSSVKSVVACSTLCPV
jgi:hypothetical protein